ncbi:hypothetical protein DPMN_034802 [Dreissena polymorpha]|uniref:TRPM-like domain-containing protein n=1 Tax=Dreissena polymorpha TaxID=45954 RepID=A0A9D4M6C7_DREPO|nr:hypothetical protein DPMN_034802 [Dreissena polymorpha]
MDSNEVESIALLQQEDEQYGCFKVINGESKPWCKLGKDLDAEKITNTWGIKNTHLLISYSDNQIDNKFNSRSSRLKSALEKIIRLSAAVVLTYDEPSILLQSVVENIEIESDLMPVVIAILPWETNTSIKKELLENGSNTACSYGHISHFVFCNDSQEYFNTYKLFADQLSRTFKIPFIAIINSHDQDDIFMSTDTSQFLKSLPRVESHRLSKQDDSEKEKCDVTTNKYSRDDITKKNTNDDLSKQGGISDPSNKSMTDINDDLSKKDKSNESTTDKNDDLSNHYLRDDKSTKGENVENSQEGANGGQAKKYKSNNEFDVECIDNASETDVSYESIFSDGSINESNTDRSDISLVMSSDDDVFRKTDLDMFNKIVATACKGNNKDVDYLKLVVVLNVNTNIITDLIIKSPKWDCEESHNYREHMLARAISLDYSSVTMCILTASEHIELGALEFGEPGHSSMKCIQTQVQAMGINMVQPDTKTDINELAFVWLFVWALFNGKFAVANKIWTTCIVSKIASSLLACLCIDFVKATIYNRNKWQEYDYHLKKYTKRAITKLNLCYKVKPAMAKLMLVRKRDDFGGSSILQIAKTNKEFIEQPACQDTINDIWMGSIELERNPKWKIGLCLILPIFASILLRFKEDKAHKIRNIHFLKAMAEKLYYFLNSPIVKFLYSTLSFIAFVLMFALDILFNVFDNYTFGDLWLMVWVANILTEEIKLFIDRAVCFRDPLTWMDITAIATFICGKSLQLTGFLDEGRILFAISFMTFTLRFLNVFSVLENIGPLLVIIGRMFKDLTRLLLILSVVYLSFAVTIQTVLYPVLTLNWLSISALITRHYWNIFGDFSKTLEELQGKHAHTIHAQL